MESFRSMESSSTTLKESFRREPRFSSKGSQNDVDLVFAVGDPVMYFSRSVGQWLPAIVQGYNRVHTQGAAPWGAARSMWSYQLDVHPQASPSLVAARPAPAAAEVTASSSCRFAPQWVNPGGFSRSAPSMAQQQQCRTDVLRPQLQQQSLPVRTQQQCAQRAISQASLARMASMPTFAAASPANALSVTMPSAKLLPSRPTLTPPTPMAATKAVVLTPATLSKEVAKPTSVAWPPSAPTADPDLLEALVPEAAAGAAKVEDTQLAAEEPPEPEAEDQVKAREQPQAASQPDAASTASQPAIEKPQAAAQLSELSAPVRLASAHEASPSVAAAPGSASVRAYSMDRLSQGPHMAAAAATPSSHQSGQGTPDRPMRWGMAPTPESASRSLSASTRGFPVHVPLASPVTPPSAQRLRHSNGLPAQDEMISSWHHTASASATSARAVPSSLSSHTEPPSSPPAGFRAVKASDTPHAVLRQISMSSSQTGLQRQGSSSQLGILSSHSSPAVTARGMDRSKSMGQLPRGHYSDARMQLSRQYSARQLGGGSVSITIQPRRDVQGCLSSRHRSPSQPSSVRMPLAAQAAVSGFHLEQQSLRAVSTNLGLPPEMWGIRLDQLQAIENHPLFESGYSTRDIVARIIRPETSGRALGYALLKNSISPLRAAIMVSHAWDESFSDFTAALRHSEHQGALWVAAAAIYQSEESVMHILSNPAETLNQVLHHSECLLCVLAAGCNIFERLWCLYEMSSAMEMGLEVRTTRKPKGFSAAWSLDQGFLATCSQPVDSRAAQCGPSSLPSRSPHEQALRRAIEMTPGSYEGINRSVELARLKSLAKSRDQLLGGGWSNSEIGREFTRVIDAIAVRIGVPTPAKANAAVTRMPLSPSSASRSQGDLTPRTRHRDRWAKVTTL
eukprot:TRINITY_DN3136_c0_g2_i1.p1 TRINITY_DN3136_c0_g2~~TRINITY_DN3136_c0_g2_i1.p1  ORF type:complete len:906 (+),score=124.55 TRINITY_DN3136_c0_g2_i1:35-2752(+)